MSTIRANVVQNASGGATTLTDLYPARAWVNFNGIGTVFIRNDGNVSSITDIGTGRFNVNFSSSLTSADYALSYDINSYETNNATVNSTLEGSSAASVVSLMTTSAVRVTSASTTANYEASHNLVSIVL